MPRYKPIHERFLGKILVNPKTSCWEWQGTLVGLGYGVLGRERGTGNMMASHYAYEHYIGPVPEGAILRHFVCDNPPCVNPHHLQPGSHGDNMKDMEKSGRARIFSNDDVKAIVSAVSSGRSKLSIAKEYGVAHSTIDRALDKAAEGDFGGDIPSAGSKVYTILTDEQREQVMIEIAKGRAIINIAVQFGVDRKTIRNIRAGKGGAASAVEKRRAVIDDEVLKDLLAQGLSQFEIGRRFGVSQSKVSRVVIAKGLGKKNDAPGKEPPP